jgi:hypothetical protein
MEAHTIEWHKENYINSSGFEDRLIKDLNRTIKEKIRYLNNVAAGNRFSLFQIQNAEGINKKSFSDRYCLKLWETKFVGDIYSMPEIVRG